MRRLARAILLIGVAVLAAAAGALLVRASALDVEVPPDWRAGPLAVYLLSFPGDGSTLSGSVSVSLAVWNADPDDTVRILLDGEVAAEIDHEGVFTYSWRLRDSHHVAVVSRYRIFAEAAFWVKPPPPAPQTVPLQEFLEELKKQRERIVLYMVMATAAGVPAGIWTKKKTKIRSEWAFTLPSLVLTVGYWRMAQLYALIPFGVAWALTYALAREYANYLGVFIIQAGLTERKEIPLYEESRAIVGISPRYWRTGFIRTMAVKFEGARETITFIARGMVIRCVVVKGYDNYVEDMEKGEIRITCDPALTRVLREAQAVEWMQDRLADMEFKTMFTERALRSLVAFIIGEMERVITDYELDKVKTPEELRRRLRKAEEEMKRTLEQKAPEVTGNVAEAEGAAGQR